MKVILQRVKEAKVSVEKRDISKIKQGFLLLVGFKQDDGLKEIEYIARKIFNLRIFSDEDGKMNLNIRQIGGEILSVSQFTLYADVKKGNRPNFIEAQSSQLAEQNYEIFNKKLVDLGVEVKTGKFGADMQVSLINDGPVTIIYDTKGIV